jgi:hypothetical protein
MELLQYLCYCVTTSDRATAAYSASQDCCAQLWKMYLQSLPVNRTTLQSSDIPAQHLSEHLPIFCEKNDNGHCRNKGYQARQERTMWECCSEDAMI